MELYAPGQAAHDIASVGSCLQGLDFNDDLTLGGPAGIGYGKANLSSDVLTVLTEVAVSEQVWLPSFYDL